MAVTKMGSLTKGVPSAGLVAERTYTAAEFNALTTYEELVATPGPDKAVIVDGVTVFKDGATAFGGIAANDDLEIRYGSDAGAEVFDVELTGFLDSGSAQARRVYPDSGVSNIAVNQGVGLHLGGAVTGGSPVHITLNYHIENVG